MTYAYTSTPFTFCMGDCGGYESRHLSVSLVLNGPLAQSTAYATENLGEPASVSLDGAGGLLSSWSLSDGYGTYDSTTAGLTLYIKLLTDANGGISEWIFQILNESEGTDAGTLSSGGRGEDWSALDPARGISAQVPGTWTHLPEPASFGFAALGLGGAWLLRRRQQD